MRTLRDRCPWDARQTHRTLVQYLVEETAEVIEVIESGTDSTGIDHDHLREELGDLLLQVFFHSTIAAESDPDFTVGSVAGGIADKLIARHPYVYGDGDVPEDLNRSWEARKAEEKGRTSVLEGIPEQLSALARANKIISRARSRSVPVTVPELSAGTAVDAESIGGTMISLVAAAQSRGIDPEQAARDAVRRLESDVLAAEAGRTADGSDQRPTPQGS
ncbi:MazG family protein [Microlunatus soli]|nr:MazG family protein [Microlunatus soli]